MASIITQISCGFDSLNDDTHGLILEFVGKKSYYAYGATNKRCNQIYLSKEWSKETFLFGYAPLAVIQESCVRSRWNNRLSVGYGVLYYNRRDVLEWAFLKQQEHPNILYSIFIAAVKVGKFDILNEIHDRSTKDVLDLYHFKLDSVARSGKLETLKWLETRSYLDRDQLESCAHSAAEGGHLNVLEWLQTKHPFNEHMKRYCADSAAEGGKLNVLEWLHDNGYSFGPWTINGAAGGGHLNILVWLQTKLSFDEEMKRDCAESAAMSGKLNVLVWLNENGCSFDSQIIASAAADGHLHVLEWLRNNNCPWDKFCYEGAAEGGHVHVLDWLRDNECPRGDAELELYEEALEDDVNVWLFDNGFSVFPYNSDFEIDEYESYYEGGDYHHYGYEYDSD